jgi:uncharacterized membrane protein
VSDDERESDPQAAERLTFFSDAVVAIAITLLAIELPVPEGGTLHAFWASVRHDDGHYAAFLISFVVIAAAWFDHHDLFRYVHGADARLKMLNMWWLFCIVVNPFATKLLIVGGQSLTVHALRWGFYALLQILESAMLYAMLRHLIARGLADPPRSVTDSMARKSGSLILGFGLSIPVFFATTDGWLLWLVGPVLAGVFRQRQRRTVRRRRASAGGCALERRPG